MEPDAYTRIAAQLTVLEAVISNLVRDASPKAKSDIREELLAITSRDRVDLGPYGEAEVSTAERLLSAANLHRG